MASWNGKSQLVLITRRWLDPAISKKKMLLTAQAQQAALKAGIFVSGQILEHNNFACLAVQGPEKGHELVALFGSDPTT